MFHSLKLGSNVVFPDVHNVINVVTGVASFSGIGVKKSADFTFNQALKCQNVTCV